LRAEEDTPADYLQAILVALKVADAERPTEEEAVRVDAEVRAVYHRRLLARVASLKARRGALQQAQMEQQQNFNRNRNPTPAQSAEFKASMETAAFKLGVVEDRIVEESEAVAARMGKFVDVLRKDLRLQSVYDPEGYRARLEKEGRL
jgi:hypothetical protein